MSSFDMYALEEDKLGMTVTSGSVVLKKDSQNLVGVSIGGGAPYCPCLYVVQVFDATPASSDSKIQAGDEITGVGGVSVKGKSKVEVARLIQSYKDSVVILFNKLHADPKQGKTLDIVLKKMKHRVVENITSSTADALGLSRAILVNDGLLKKMDELNATAVMFRGLVYHCRCLARTIFRLSKVHRNFGEIMSQIGMKEPQLRAGSSFSQFGEAHRKMERFAIEGLKKLKPMVSDLNTFLTKAIPDTKLTVKRYLDVKFEYLSYCLKVKEMDDEEYSFNALQEPLYRVETGNYEYRLILRCRQEARTRFAQLRNDVLIKLELLDNKHVQDTVIQLQIFVNALSVFHNQCYNVMKAAKIFPLEMDLSRNAFAYESDVLYSTDNDQEDEADNFDEDIFLKDELPCSEPACKPTTNELVNDLDQLLDLKEESDVNSTPQDIFSPFSKAEDSKLLFDSPKGTFSGDLITID